MMGREGGRGEGREVGGKEGGRGRGRGGGGEGEGEEGGGGLNPALKVGQTTVFLPSLKDLCSPKSAERMYSQGSPSKIQRVQNPKTD